MAKGHENLIPASERSREEARENGRKGGRASGEARRRKKAMRALLKEAVQMQLKDLPADMRTAIMAAARLSDDSLTIGEALIGALICASCGGDARMMKLLLDTLGESADIRIRERELKRREQKEEEGTQGAPSEIVFTFTRRETTA